jgi:hypothetical protein
MSAHPPFDLGHRSLFALSGYSPFAVSLSKGPRQPSLFGLSQPHPFGLSLSKP